MRERESLFNEFLLETRKREQDDYGGGGRGSQNDRVRT